MDVPCGLDSTTGKIGQTRQRPREVLQRNEQAWKQNPHAFARARFLPIAPRQSPPTRQKPSGHGAHLGKMTLNPGVTAFCFASCRSDQTALDANIKGQQQGAMSFCLLEAASALKHRCTYEQLVRKANEYAADIREKYMPTMDQFIQLSFCPNSAPTEVVFLDEKYATVAQHTINQRQQRVNNISTMSEIKQASSPSGKPSPGSLHGDVRPPEAQAAPQQATSPQKIEERFAPLPVEDVRVQNLQSVALSEVEREQENSVTPSVIPNLFGVPNLLGGLSQAQAQAQQIPPAGGTWGSPAPVSASYTAAPPQSNTYGAALVSPSYAVVAPAYAPGVAYVQSTPSYGLQGTPQLQVQHSSVAYAQAPPYQPTVGTGGSTPAYYPATTQCP